MWHVVPACVTGEYCRIILRGLIAPVCVTGEVLQNCLEMMYSYCACLCDGRSIAECSWDDVLCLFVWQAKCCRILLRLCIEPVYVTGEVLQNRLEMMYYTCLCDRQGIAESCWCCIVPVCVTGKVLQSHLKMTYCACLCDRRSIAECSWDDALRLFVWQAKCCRILLRLCIAPVCVTGEVLQNRLGMARDLKLLTDSAHSMTSSELEQLRLHIKVAWSDPYIVLCNKTGQQWASLVTF